ncbi:MAG: hypothetical protein UZ01_02564, partial [Candidatus Brocadia sinica]
EKFLKTESSDTEGLTKARAMKEHFRALLAELEFKEKNGELVPVEAVRKQAFETARMVRDSLLNIPNRVSPILAAESDHREINQILTKEIVQCLENLSNNFNSEVKDEKK